MSSNSHHGEDNKSSFRSHDCVDVVFDGPEDTTVRPLTGKHRERAAAEWAKIQYWEAVERGEINPDVTPPPPVYR